MSKSSSTIRIAFLPLQVVQMFIKQKVYIFLRVIDYLKGYLVFVFFLTHIGCFLFSVLFGLNEAQEVLFKVYIRCRLPAYPQHH